MGKKINEGDGVKRETLTWTPQMDNAFIQSMLTQQYEGNRIDGTFTSTAYSNMVDELQKKLNIRLSKAHLKNRLRTLKEHFSQCYDLFRGVGLSGFAWNPETKLFTADEDVWQDLIAARPDAVKWKTKQVFNYEELSELFAKDRATGGKAETAKEKCKKWAAGSEFGAETIDQIDDLLTANEVTLENFSAADDVQILSGMDYPQEHQSSASKSIPRKRKNDGEDEMENSKGKKKKVEVEGEMTKILTSMEHVADALKEGNNILKETNLILEQSRQRVYSEEEIFKQLKIIGLEEDAIYNAYLFLAKNPNDARILFGCPLPMRKRLLEDIMKQASS